MNFIQRFLFGNRSSELSEDQSKALLDILIIVMMADGRQESKELEELTAAIKRMNLDDEAAVNAYVEHRKREFSSGVDYKQIFAHSAKILNKPWMREHAYYLAAKFASSNNEIHAGETEALHYLIVAMDISKKKLRMISQRLIEEEIV